MIENACPFAPGVAKPESMQSTLSKGSLMGKIRIGKVLILLGSIIALTLLYRYSYPSLNWGGSSVLFQDWYIVKMSIYTYLLGMITYYLKGYQKQKRVN
jgi:hypothetical protein